MSVVGYAAPEWIVDTVPHTERRGAYRVRVRRIGGGEHPYPGQMCRPDEASHIAGILEDYHAAHWDRAVVDVTRALRRAGRAALSEYEIAEFRAGGDDPLAPLAPLRDGAWWAALDRDEE